MDGANSLRSVTNPHAVLASGITTVTPAALARSRMAATPWRVLRAGRFAEGSIHRARDGAEPPNATGGAARTTPIPAARAARRTCMRRYSVAAGGFPPQRLQL